MEENEKIDPEYLTGFNEGYKITKSAPEIAETLIKAESKSQRLQGFKDGRTQFLLEKEKELMPEWLRDKKESIETKEKSQDKDKE